MARAIIIGTKGLYLGTILVIVFRALRLVVVSN
jgi:hypothetical protein